MILPSVSAVEFNTVVETNKQNFSERVQDAINEWKANNKQLSIEELRQNVNELKQQLMQQQPVVDIEMILIVIFSILTMVLSGKPSIYLTLAVLIYSFAVVLGFVSGEPVVKCDNVHGTFVLSITYFLVVLENTLISNKAASKAVCTITFLIGYLLALSLMTGT